MGHRWLTLLALALWLGACERPTSVVPIDLGPTTDFLDPSLPDARPKMQHLGDCYDDSACGVGTHCELFMLDDEGRDRGLCVPIAPCTDDSACGDQAFCRFPDYLCRPPGRCTPLPDRCVSGSVVCDCAGHPRSPCSAARAGASLAWYGRCDASPLPCRAEWENSLALELLSAVRHTQRCQDSTECWPVVALGDCCRVAISAAALPGALERLRRVREQFEARCDCAALRETIAAHGSWDGEVCAPRGVCEDGTCR